MGSFSYIWQRIHHEYKINKNIICQFRTRHFPSFASLIQAESKEIVFIRIVAPKVSFPTQNESAQSDTCRLRYLQNIETCASDAKEASIFSNLLLICLHPSAAPSTYHSSNHILCKGSFTNHLSQMFIWKYVS